MEETLTPEQEERLAELEAKYEPTEEEELTPEQEKRLAELEDKHEAKPSMAKSALLGAAEGVTLGFTPEIAGAASAASAQVSNLVNSLFSDKFSYEPPAEAFEKAKAEIQQEIEQAAKENPAIFTASDIGGSLVLPGGLAAKFGRKLMTKTLKYAGTKAGQLGGKSVQLSKKVKEMYNKIPSELKNSMAGAGLVMEPSTAITVLAVKRYGPKVIKAVTEKLKGKQAGKIADLIKKGDVDEIVKSVGVKPITKAPIKEAVKESLKDTVSGKKKLIKYGRTKAEIAKEKAFKEQQNAVANKARDDASLKERLKQLKSIREAIDNIK